jgi:histone-lysine N-methyltransferase SETMAR
MGVAHNPLIEAAVHAVEAHIIGNKETIQADHFNSQDHVHSVLGQKTCSACGILPQGSTINTGVCDRLRKLCHAIQNKRRGMLGRGVVMLHDSARPHTATTMQDLIAKFGWEQFNHPLYSPDLVPSDFYVFLHLKTLLGGRRFHNNEVKKAINTWFASQAASFYNAGIQKLLPCYKCLNSGGNYVKK